MNKKRIVEELTKIKRSTVDTIVSRIEENNYKGMNFIVEEEMNKSYSDITKILLEEME